MNNLDVILENILKDSKEKESEILNQARKKADELFDRETAKAKDEASEILAKAKKEKDLLIKNDKVSAQRQARDISISAKNKVIDQILAKLLESLESLSPSEYKDFVKNSLEKSKITKGEILLEKDKRDLFKEDELGGLRLSDKTCNSGFIIKDENIEYDNSFESLIKDNKDILRKEISDHIFK